MERVGSTAGDRGDVADASKLGGVVNLADADFGDGAEGRKQFRNWRVPADTHRTDAVDTDLAHVGLRPSY